MIRFLLLFLTFFASLDISARSPRTRQRTDGVLDSYPGAAAAYVLRPAGRQAVFNPILRVVRSSDSAERDVYWYELRDGTLTTWTGANNGEVLTWYDVSRNGRNATQATPANRPRIVSAGALESLAAKPSLFYDDTNDELATVSITVAHPITDFSVSNTTGVSDEYIYSLNGTQHVNFTRITSGAPALFAGTFLVPVGNIRNSVRLKFGLFNGTSSQVATNGGLAASGNVGNGNPAGVLKIGGGFGPANQFGGWISELVVYASNQSTNRTGIESKINGFYGIY